MKTLFILFFGVFLITGLMANPLYPQSISELYFDGDDWTIELFDYNGVFGEFQLQFIVTTNDTVLFHENSVFFLDEPVLITQDNLQEPLFIDKNGDLVQIYYTFGEPDLPDLPDWIYIGNHPYSTTNPLYPGQSLARVVFSSPHYTNFLLAKESQHSLGENPFAVNSRGTLAGYVYDANEIPVANAEIRYSPSSYQAEFYTDENGFFENDDMYAMNYEVKVFINDVQFGSLDLTIEPDLTTVHDFYTNYDSSSAETNELTYHNFSLSNYPNPYYPENGSNSTAISFAIPAHFSESATITIYNLKGQKVAMLNGSNAKSIAGEGFSIPWNGSNRQGKQVQSGVYMYVLEIDGKEVATSKMIILK